jgi:hypothetical protein
MNSIESLKVVLENHIDELKDANPERSKEINELYRKIMIAHEQSINKMLASGNLEAQALIKKLDNIQAEVSQAFSQSQDMAKTIDKIAAGVKIATKITGFLV